MKKTLIALAQTAGATFIVACQRILHAREMRGLYP